MIYLSYFFIFSFDTLSDKKAILFKEKVHFNYFQRFTSQL